jgi:multiple sugar transport system ATP-binding protein
LELAFAEHRLPLPPAVVASRPGIRAFEGKEVVLGIRPEDMEDAALVSDAPPDRRMRVNVDLRESLGSDVLVHFRVAAPPVRTEDTLDLAADTGTDGLEHIDSQAAIGESTFVARHNPRTGAMKGDPIELVVDTSRLHFFDPDGGAGIYS